MIWSRVIEKLFGLNPVVCQSCETLRIVLDRQLDINRELTQSIIKPVEPIQTRPNETMNPIAPNYMPWRVRQQMLQNEDRAKAAILRKTNEELESAVLGADSDSKSGAGTVSSQ